MIRMQRALIATSLALASSFAMANLLTNGSLNGVPGEASSPTGWSGYTTELVLPGGLNSTSGPGGIFAYLMPASTDGGTFALGQAGATLNETLRQTITGLTVGSTYQVDFEYANGGWYQGTSIYPDEVGDGYLVVSLGTSVQNTGVLSFDGFGSQTWHQESMQLVADSSTLDLTFECRAASGIVRMAVDGVSVEQVPAPSTNILMLVGAGAMARRRRA